MVKVVVMTVSLVIIVMNNGSVSVGDSGMCQCGTVLEVEK